MIVMLYFAIL